LGPKGRIGQRRHYAAIGERPAIPEMRLTDDLECGTLRQPSKGRIRREIAAKAERGVFAKREERGGAITRARRENRACPDVRRLCRKCLCRERDLVSGGRRIAMLKRGAGARPCRPSGRRRVDEGCRGGCLGGGGLRQGK